MPVHRDAQGYPTLKQIVPQSGPHVKDSSYVNNMPAASASTGSHVQQGSGKRGTPEALLARREGRGFRGRIPLDHTQQGVGEEASAHLVKVRYYGFFSPGLRQRLATLHRHLSGAAADLAQAPEVANEVADSTQREIPSPHQVVRCPSCGQVMQRRPLMRTKGGQPP